MPDWTETTIGSQIQLQRGFDITKSDQRLGSVPVVSSGGVGSYHDTAAVKGPGVVLGRKGTLGSVFYVEKDFWPHDTTLFVRDFGCSHPRFVYYFFKGMSEDLLALDVGTSNPALNRNHVHPIAVSWPSRPEQERIADLLGALDDKIALNRRMNHTLEATAAALFRSWFVDFDPVVAKAEGRRATGVPASLHDAVASAFSEELEDSLPVGWRFGAIADLARFVNGRNFTTGASRTGRMVIRIAELGGEVRGSTVFNNVSASDENIARAGDLLFSWSGSLRVARWHGDESLVNQHIFKVVCGTWPQWFVHHHLDLALPVFQEIAAGKATTMGHIKREHLSQVRVALPPHSVLEPAGDVIEPLYNRIHSNERENRTLAALRDTLLPRLLSGTIRLRDTERAVGTAV